MADLNNAQKAPLLVDGAEINADTPGVTSSDAAVATVANGGDGKYWVVGQGAGTATITASYLGRSGSIDVLVTEAPYVLSLGAPVAK